MAGVQKGKKGMTLPAWLQAFTTLILGLVAGYIAWRQWRTAQDRLVLDLFERRFQVFQELTHATRDALGKSRVSVQDLANFDAATEKARFLFGPEIHSYLGEIRSRVIQVIALGRALPEMPDGPRSTSAEVKVVEALNQLNAFYGKLADLVTPYLRVGPQPPHPWRYFLGHVREARDSLVRRWRRDKSAGPTWPRPFSARRSRSLGTLDAQHADNIVSNCL
jgi:hypothetical protein